MPKARSTSARYLSLGERERIADSISQGLSLRVIAAQLGRSPSTVAREVVRNRDVVTGRYGPFTADLAAQVRARRPRLRKVEQHPPTGQVHLGPVAAAVVAGADLRDPGGAVRRG